MKSAAETFRPNPDFDTEQAITQLGIGEALVSTLDQKGVPAMVERTLVRPPNSRVGPITDAERKAVMNASPVKGEYDERRTANWPTRSAEAHGKAQRDRGRAGRRQAGGEEDRRGSRAR